MRDTLTHPEQSIILAWLALWLVGVVIFTPCSPGSPLPSPCPPHPLHRPILLLTWLAVRLVEVVHSTPCTATMGPPPEELAHSPTQRLTPEMYSPGIRTNLQRSVEVRGGVEGMKGLRKQGRTWSRPKRVWAVLREMRVRETPE